MFKSNPNPEKTFGGGKHYQDLISMTFEEVVTAFEGRVKDWFIRPVTVLVKDNNTVSPNGFQITQACCVVIDLLSQFRNDLPASSASSYIDYLKELDPLFAEEVNPAIDSWDPKTGKLRKIENLAQAFYHGFRCGIVHSAMIMDYGRITDRPDIAPQMIQARKWGKTIKDREVVVSPALLLRSVIRGFETYIQALKDQSQQALRQHFANKMKRDFGVILNP